MRLLSLLLLPLLLLQAQVNPRAAAVRTVYLLPMQNGLDQYLANQLTAKGVVEVTTDATKADAVLTDRIGPGFEDRWAELYPPPPPPPAPEDADKDEKAKERREESGEPNLNFKTEPRRESSFGRGKGNLFLVLREDRSVIWSTHARPKYGSAEELDRLAARVADLLKKHRTPAK